MFIGVRVAMALQRNKHPQNVLLSRERFWLLGLFLTAVIFFAMAAFVVMSDFGMPA